MADIVAIVSRAAIVATIGSAPIEASPANRTIRATVRVPATAPPVNVRGLTQTVLPANGGTCVEMAPGIYVIPDVICVLWYGNITGIFAPVLGRGWLADGIGSSAARRGCTFRVTNAGTVLEFAVRRSTGSGASLFHTVGDVRAHGPRLYWGLSAADGSLPSTQDKRVGQGDMIAGTDWSFDSIQHGPGLCDTPMAMGRRSSASSNSGDDGITYEGARLVYIGRLPTPAEWAAAAAGDLSWSEGDPDVIFDSAANVPDGTTVDDSGDYLDTSNVVVPAFVALPPAYPTASGGVT